MISRILVFFSKLLIKILRITGRNGSALPGLMIEKIYPEFLEKNLKPFHKKIIIVTGTNGKTTTTKMLSTALVGSGKTIITNGTGSNMTRGLISTLVDHMSYFGSLKEVDWFVLEMDEAYAPLFTKKVNPKVVLALNVLRDQLDRYGEIDRTAKLIESAAMNAEVFVYNAIDPLLADAALRLKQHKVDTYSFSVSSSLVRHVENEQTLHSQHIKSLKKDDTNSILEKLEDINNLQQLHVKSSVLNENLIFMIPIEGFYNALNAAAVVSVLSVVSESKQLHAAVNSLAKMEAPFGRGERLTINDKIVTVALVKNPSGFMGNLETFVKGRSGEAVLFVINDKFADGRDVSWLWDVNFEEMISKDSDLDIYVSGSRAYDMSLRLKYDSIDAKITTNVNNAISEILNSDHRSITVIPTYTALFEVRMALSKFGKVPRIW